MTGPEHYREAERLLSAASFTRGSSPVPVTRNGQPLSQSERDHLVARAQVHATLANAAATATQTVRLEDNREWFQAAGVSA